MAEENIARGMSLKNVFRAARNGIRFWPEWVREAHKIGKLPPMKKIFFAKGELLPTLRQNQKITIRKFRKEAYDLIEDEAFIGSFQDGFNIILVATKDTEIKLFSEVTDKEAKAAGFKHAKNALWKLKKYFYPDLKPEDKAAIINYEVLQIDNTPVVSANEFIWNK